MIGREDVEFQKVLAEVIRLAPGLHKAGTFSVTTLNAIVRHAAARPIERSVETGAGASTILFSHLSRHHTVFAVDGGTNSIRGIESSPLLRRDVVSFVEGPTQVTLPQYTFTERLQLALIDGPHAYPFPDLEYYYFYPHLDRDALLIVDDIHIPTIANMFDFIRVDDMFDLQEVVETTAFFRRTAAPTFSPVSDGWSGQRYNKRAFESTPAEACEGPQSDPTDDLTRFYIDRLGPHIDPTAQPRLTVRRGEQLVLAGWALDAARRRPAEAVELVLDGVRFRTAVRIPRADVATVHGDEAYLRSGFDTWLPGKAITPGAHRLEILIVLADGRPHRAGAVLTFEAV